MKKFITLLSLFLLIGITSQADDITTKAKEMAQTAVNTADSAITAVDTSSTFRTFYSDLKSGVGALSSSLKVGATEVFKIVVKQQLVQSITYLITVIILVVAGFLVLSAGWKAVDRENASRKDGENYNRPYSLDDSYHFGYIMISGVLMAFGIGIFVIQGVSIVTGFVNPEYGAIMSIMDMVKKF